MSTNAVDPVNGDRAHDDRITDDRATDDRAKDDQWREVTANVCRRLDVGQATAAAFVRLLYRRLAPADLSRRDSDTLTATACSLLQLAGVRQQGEPLVRVSAAATETVVEIVTDDMPFLVDSIVIELHRQGADIDLLLHPVVSVRRAADGRLVEVVEAAGPVDGSTIEAVMR